MEGASKDTQGFTRVLRKRSRPSTSPTNRDSPSPCRQKVRSPNRFAALEVGDEVTEVVDEGSDIAAEMRGWDQGPE